MEYRFTLDFIYKNAKPVALLSESVDKVSISTETKTLYIILKDKVFDDIMTSDIILNYKKGIKSINITTFDQYGNIVNESTFKGKIIDSQTFNYSYDSHDALQNIIITFRYE